MAQKTLEIHAQDTSMLAAHNALVARVNALEERLNTTDTRIDAVGMAIAKDIAAILALVEGKAKPPTTNDAPAEPAKVTGKRKSKVEGKAATPAGVPPQAKFVCDCTAANGTPSWGATQAYADKHKAKGHTVTSL